VVSDLCRVEQPSITALVIRGGDHASVHRVRHEPASRSDFALLAVSLMLSSDSGSGTGAASRSHARSDAVSGAARNALTSTYDRHQASYSNVRSVRIEGARGSKPLNSTGLGSSAATFELPLFCVGAKLARRMADAKRRG
jgi:hypothetical protein